MPIHTDPPREGSPAAPRSPSIRALRAAAVLALACLACGRGAAPPSTSFTTTTSGVPGPAPEVDRYRIAVYDELTLTVLGHPELSGPTRVLPDGSIALPGVGSLYTLNDTLEELTEKVQAKLGGIIRYPHATVAVTNFGERRVYVMGEVVIPGDHQYHRGLTVTGAIAMAGGFNNQAKRSSVILLRRVSPTEATATRLDVGEILEGKNLATDIAVKPYDIVYVPKTFIASLNTLMDQYFRQMTPPFTLYTEGWNAFHLDDANVRFVTR